MLADCKRGKKVKRLTAENWSITFALSPKLVLAIAQNYIPRFGPKGMEVLILLNCQDAHIRNSPRSALLA